MMFAQKWLTSFKKTCLPADRERRERSRKPDSVITEQVKKILQEADQKLILMVRG